MKPFTTLTIIFLSLLSVVQLVRFLQGWDVIINGVAIPTWVSALACLIAGGLAAMLWRESRR